MTSYLAIYEKLYNHYGPQGWWPAETPFEMMIGAILVQNTNWRNVEKAIENLKPFLTPEGIDRLSETELAELIRPSGFYQVKAKRVKAFIEWYRAFDSDAANLRDELLSVKGIGHETADVILLYAFEIPVFVVDAYARRIFHRVGFDMPKSYDAFREQVEMELPGDVSLFNEFHALLVEHAKEHCKVKPICEGCPLYDICERRLEI